MDTEAQSTERDRSSRPSDTADASQQAVGPDGPEGRSRFALVARITDLLPGGRISLTLLICLLFLLLLNAFVVKPFQIPSGSMENGLRIGDRVLVNRLAYRFGAEPRRGDVVVFDGTGYFGDADYVKRVVGVGGDHVVCCDDEGRIQVNGRPVDESTYLYPGDSPSTVPFDVEVPDGTLFVLGDHRSASSDSRDHLGSPGGGMIPVDDVIGRADWIMRSLLDVTRLHRPDAYARVPAATGASTDTAVTPAGVAVTSAGAVVTRTGAVITSADAVVTHKGAAITPAGAVVTRTDAVVTRTEEAFTRTEAAGARTVAAGTPADRADAHG